MYEGRGGEVMLLDWEGVDGVGPILGGSGFTLTGGGVVALWSGDVGIERRTMLGGVRYYEGHWWFRGGIC